MFRPRKWTKAEDDQLLALMAEGKSTAVVAKEIRRSEAAILQRAAFLKQREK
jgi:hypothetical protein